MLATVGVDSIKLCVRRTQHNFGFNCLAKVRMEFAINPGFAHGGIAVEHGFNLFGENFTASQIDNGSLAREQKKKAFRVQTN